MIRRAKKVLRTNQDSPEHHRKQEGEGDMTKLVRASPGNTTEGKLKCYRCITVRLKQIQINPD